MAISSALGSSALAPAGLGFRNKIINGGFDIWQRGTSFSAAGYTADRWVILADGSGATRAISQQTFTPGNAISGQEPSYYLRYNQSVAGSSATYNIIEQRIEDVRACAGQTVTISFYAKTDSARTVTSQVQQNFGSGGSSEVQAVATQNIALTTAWQKFTYTFTMPSISGKTIGTSSYVAFRINVPINATFTVDLWGVQVEANSVPTPFEQRPIGVELRLCQRYYYRRGQSTYISAYQPASSTIIYTTLHPVTMRTTPTLGAIGGTWNVVNSCAQPTIAAYGQDSVTIFAVTNSGVTNANQSAVYTKNDGTTYIEIGAEL